MKKELFDQYISDRIEIIDTQLKQYKVDHDSECLHKIRVEIKKVRSIMSFLQTQKKTKLTFKILDKIFESVGELRELQLNLHFIMALPHFPKKRMAELQDKEVLLSKKLLVDTLTFRKKLKEAKGKLSIPVFKLTLLDIEQFFKKKRQRAVLYVQKGDKKSLHQFRMELKEILYVYKALPSKIQKQLKLDESYLSDLQENIGEWHDLTVALDFLIDETISAKSKVYVARLEAEENDKFRKALLIGKSFKKKAWK